MKTKTLGFDDDLVSQAVSRMTQRLLIPLVAALATVASPGALAQSDETFDSSSVGSPASVGVNGVVDDTPEAGPTDAPDTAATVDAEREADLDATMAAEQAAMDDNTTPAAPSDEKPLPDAEGSDYGANDFRAPDDSEIAAASETAAARDKTRRDNAGERDTQTPADDIGGEQNIPSGEALGDNLEESAKNNDYRPIADDDADDQTDGPADKPSDDSAEREADRKARAADMTAPPSPDDIDTRDY